MARVRRYLLIECDGDEQAVNLLIEEHADDMMEWLTEWTENAAVTGGPANDIAEWRQ